MLKYFLFVFILIILSCSKQQVTQQSFSEKMIGKWELRDGIDPLFNRDGNWSVLNEPYFTAILNSDQTYSFSQRGILIEEGS